MHHGALIDAKVLFEYLLIGFATKAILTKQIWSLHDQC